MNPTDGKSDHIIRITTWLNEVHKKTVQASDPAVARRLAERHFREEFPDLNILRAEEISSDGTVLIVNSRF